MTREEAIAAVMSDLKLSAGLKPYVGRIFSEKLAGDDEPIDRETVKTIETIIRRDIAQL